MPKQTHSLLPSGKENKNNLSPVAMYTPIDTSKYKFTQKTKDPLPIIIHTSIDTMMYRYYQNKKINNHAYALAVYVFLYKTVRIQNNIRTWAKNIFIQKGLRISHQKLALVKNDLIAMGLIKVKKGRDNKGRFSNKSYIEVQYVWKEKTIKKLFCQKYNETTQYKVAKKLLMMKYENLEPIYSKNAFGFDFEINLTLKGTKQMQFPSYFYFENNLLKANFEFSQGNEVNYTIPTNEVSDIILELANQEQYSFESINKVLQVTD